MKNVMMAFCLIVTVLFIWVWHNKTRFDDHFRQAHFHFNNSEFDQAIEAYTKAIKRSRSTIFYTKGRPVVLAYIHLTTAYLQQNQLDEAIEVSQQAIEIAPDSAFVHYNLACAYALVGENEQAISSLKKAIDLDDQAKTLARDEKAFENLRSHPQFPVD